MPWWQTNKAIVGALVLSLALAFAPPLAAALWVFAFVAWRRRKTVQQVARDAAAAEVEAAYADRPHPLADDPRSAWAYRRFVGGLQPGPVSADLGVRLLAALQPGDHVELIADAEFRGGWHASALLPKALRGTTEAIAVRTLRAWLLVIRRTGEIVVFPGPLATGEAIRTALNVGWPVSGFVAELTSAKGRKVTVKVFLDALDATGFDVIENGAGKHIRRLPEAIEVPPAPDAASLRAYRAAVPAGLPTDWKAAEEIAAAHMRATGFPDARLTGAGRDGGIDVASSLAVAQVKMLAQPVGAPAVQQLRGARLNMTCYLFYSTSGYTSAAQAMADELGVCLFGIDRTGAVEPVNAAARTLLRAVVESVGEAPSGPDAKEFADAVCVRIIAADKATDKARSAHRQRFPSQFQVVAGYLMQAMENIQKAPATFDSAESAVIYYHHTELLAAVYFRELGIPYPQGAGDAIPDTLDEFYR
ncbi:hypothetical protein ACTI_44040 [Actinoplanes sp. OR16]|uniref:restriction endonuclease n=1 Tax=Actinoplanes sp. OR16 TaxID=946334 RepID=UPI000F720BE4|nr:restriction endonuclease [Actinoplanes sp. OR16]BBH67719.1 hypothetical protein ACTI_44040 [Actinoplanes sp. OR16]